MILYVVFSEVDEGMPHILGIFSDKEKAEKVKKIDDAVDIARAYIQEFELDTVYTIEEDELRFKISGLETKHDTDNEILNSFRQFFEMGGPDTMMYEDEDGYIVQKKRLFKARHSKKS